MGGDNLLDAAYLPLLFLFLVVQMSATPIDDGHHALPILL